MDIYNRCHRNIFSIEQDLRRILIIERRLAILSISYNQTSMNSLHTYYKDYFLQGKSLVPCPEVRSKIKTKNKIKKRIYIKEI